MAFKSYLNQNFEELKKQCLTRKKLFEDEKFPANQASISKKPNEPSQIVWKRPHEIVSNPQFVVNGVQPTDLDQGEIGNCWLISALACLANNTDRFGLVVPIDQSFTENYAGIFRFRFWNYGEWTQVVVDDKLPTKNNRLIYCRNLKDTNEMFGPLLEKAYAKLNKCYSNLITGEIIDALIDLTGGVHENFKIKAISDGKVKNMNQEKLWNAIFSFFEMKSMAGCSIDAKDGKIEEVKANKLITAHAYTMLKAIEIVQEGQSRFRLRSSIKENMTDKSTIRLLKYYAKKLRLEKQNYILDSNKRIRNPWGHEASWSGKWSSDSPEWQNISNDIKAQLEFNDQTDGIFFISFEDFVKFFDQLDFVHVNLNAFHRDPTNNIIKSSVKWHCEQFNGAWVPGVNSGGCVNYGMDSFFKNPQYIFKLQLKNNQDEFVSIIVSLMQTETLRLREKTGNFMGSREALGIHVYALTEESNNSGGELTKKLNSSQMKYCDDNGIYMYQREISKRFDLKPGSYVIIPSCFKKDVAMKFLLRVFIEGEEERELTFYDVNKNDLAANDEMIEKYSNWKNSDDQNEDNVQFYDEYPNMYDEKDTNDNYDNQINSNIKHDNNDDDDDDDEYYKDNEVRNFRRANTQVTSKACSIL